MSGSWKWPKGQSGDVALAIGIGALTSVLIVGFLGTTEKLGQRLYPHMGGPWGRFFVPTLGALLAGVLVAKYFPEARGSGIPQTKAALIARNGFISLRTVIGKFICCSISLGSGISLGREGPSVQMGAGVASIVGRKLGLSSYQVQSLLPVGTAAALAAAFNTPIAAVLFTLEEVLSNLHARVLGSVVISAATSWMVLHLFLGDEPLFHVPNYRLVHPSEFLIYAVVGVIGGFMSAGFVRLLLWMRRRFMSLPAKTVTWQPAIGGLAVGILAIFIPGVLGVGYSFVNQALNGEMAMKMMIFLLLLKLPLTAICYATGNPGGIFGPSLFLGAMLGGAAGSAVYHFWPVATADPGAYALVGMGTAFAGIIRTPLTSVIMIFELTRDYSIIVPLMISNLLSFYISSRLQPVPIYEALAEQEGVHLPRSPERRDEPSFQVQDAMRPASEKMQWAVGNVTDLSVEAFPHVHPDHPLELVLHRLGESELKVLPVVDRTNPRKVLGEISVDDLLECYRREKANY